MTRSTTKAAAKPTAKSWRFPDDTLGFLGDLKSNNNREWFNANKKRYEAAVRDAGSAFCALIEAELHSVTGAAYSSKLFRIHRDVRFSKDKTPYNAHLHIAFSPVAKSRTGAAFMFGLDTGKISVGAGVFAFDKQQLDAFRETIAGPEGVKLQEILENLSRAGASISEPDLKRVPSGFDPDHPRADLLRHKGLAAWITYDDTGLATKRGLAAGVAKDFKKLKPLMDWLQTL